MTMNDVLVNLQHKYHILKSLLKETSLLTQYNCEGTTSTTATLKDNDKESASLVSMLAFKSTL